MILVLADLARWRREGRPLPAVEGFRYAEVGAVTAEALAGVDLVLAPLVEAGFDAVDVARRLAALGFGGRFRALTGPLPDAEAVRAEVRAVAPRLDFDLFILRDPPG